MHQTVETLLTAASQSRSVRPPGETRKKGSVSSDEATWKTANQEPRKENSS